MQYTKADAKKLRSGLIIDQAQGGPTAGSSPVNRSGKLLAPRFAIHSWNLSPPNFA
jgi:hypothetical protein